MGSMWKSVYTTPPQSNRNYGENLCKTSFQVGMDLQKYRNKAEMKHARRLYPAMEWWQKRSKKTTLHHLHIQQKWSSFLVFVFCHHSAVGYSLLVCFRLCLVSALFTGPSLLGIKLCINFSLFTPAPHATIIQLCTTFQANLALRCGSLFFLSEQHQ